MLVGLVGSSSGFCTCLLSSLVKTMDGADPEEMTWRWQLLSTDYKHVKVRETCLYGTCHSALFVRDAIFPPVVHVERSS